MVELKYLVTNNYGTFTFCSGVSRTVNPITLYSYILRQCITEVLSRGELLLFIKQYDVNQEYGTVLFPINMTPEQISN